MSLLNFFPPSGYQIQPPTLETILKRYSRVVPPNGRCIIAFDDFVALSVRLRAYTGNVWFLILLKV